MKKGAFRPQNPSYCAKLHNRKGVLMRKGYHKKEPVGNPIRSHSIGAKGVGIARASLRVICIIDGTMTFFNLYAVNLSDSCSKTKRLKHPEPDHRHTIGHAENR
jgi:hypothetical protein